MLILAEREMIMKKVISLMLAVLMSLSVSGAVFADAEVSENMKNAILLAKDKLEIDDETYVMEDCSETENRGEKTYSITWKSRGEYDSGNISVEIDGDGLVWGYGEYNRSSESKPLPACTWDEGKQAAQAFLEAMNPQVAKEAVFDDIIYSKYSGNFTVTYVRMHNGIKVNNTAAVTVNADTRKAVGLDSNWNKNATFEEGTPISLDQAKDVFKSDIAYDLYYYEKAPSYYADDAADNEICLIYMIKGENKYINAFTGNLETYGELAKNSGGGSSSRNEALKDEMSDSGDKPSLSEEEVAYIQEVEGLISKEEAEAKARAVSEFQLSSEMKLTAVSLTTSYRDEYIYRLSFHNGKEDEDYKFASVTVDAKDGVVISFDSSPWSYRELTEEEKAEKPAIDKANALKFIQQYYPDLAGMVENTQNNEYTTYFARVHDGVAFSNNGFSFHYRDGKLASFDLSWSKLEIPSKSAAKPLDEAYGVILGEDKFTLSYIPTYNENQCEMKLAYRLDDVSIYSAVSLRPLNYRMEEKEDFEIAYTDITGHYAENAIRKLAEVELALGDPKQTEFHPEETVKQEEFLTFVCKAFDRGTHDMYKNLVSSGILTKEEIAPKKDVTRMEAIRYIVKLFGMGEVAEKNGIFKDIYTDVSEADRGYAAIAAGYKIVNSEVTELYPENGLRRADAVMMMYNWLTK